MLFFDNRVAGCHSGVSECRDEFLAKCFRRSFEPSRGAVTRAAEGAPGKKGTRYASSSLTARVNVAATVLRIVSPDWRQALWAFRRALLKRAGVRASWLCDASSAAHLTLGPEPRRRLGWSLSAGRRKATESVRSSDGNGKGCTSSQGRGRSRPRCSRGTKLVRVRFERPSWPSYGSWRGLTSPPSSAAERARTRQAAPGIPI